MIWTRLPLSFHALPPPKRMCKLGSGAPPFTTWLYPQSASAVLLPGQAQPGPSPAFMSRRVVCQNFLEANWKSFSIAFLNSSHTQVLLHSLAFGLRWSGTKYPYKSPYAQTCCLSWTIHDKYSPITRRHSGSDQTDHSVKLAKKFQHKFLFGECSLHTVVGRWQTAYMVSCGGDSFADINVVKRVPPGGNEVMVWTDMSYRQGHFIAGSLNSERLWRDPEAHHQLPSLNA